MLPPYLKSSLNPLRPRSDIQLQRSASIGNLSCAAHWTPSHSSFMSLSPDVTVHHQVALGLWDIFSQLGSISLSAFELQKSRRSTYLCLHIALSHPYCSTTRVTLVVCSNSQNIHTVSLYFTNDLLWCLERSKHGADTSFHSMPIGGRVG